MSEKKQLSDCRILLVDDDLDLLRITAVMLRREGASVTESGGGTEAIRLMGGTRFDAVLTDMHMPMGDGYSLIGSISPCLRSRVVIVTGCSGMLRDPAGATAFGVKFVLPKPFSMSALVEAARLAIDTGRCGCEGCGLKPACPVKSAPARSGATVLPSG